MIRFGMIQRADEIGPAAEWELTADGRYTDSDLAVTYEGMDGASCKLGFKRTELAIEWVSPKAEDLSDNCLIGGAGVFPWGPYWLVDTAVPNLDEDSESAN
ncbi:MAG TPA: hypothetical protein VGJ75_03870 [Dongiaceae bacterium]|jgi:hypothetical protein